MMQETRIILDNIRSAHNVGAIFRTADGAGVKKMYLVGVTPAPIDRFGRPQKEITKTSLGATESVVWEQVSNIRVLLEKLKNEGFQIVAIEQTSESISLREFIPKEKVVYIFGYEIDGISEDFLSQADVVVEIPMKGMKESLNVSVTAGIILFRN